ncbi:MAG: 16S rRNA (uracil(1498)-N(3))-methyltransferase [Hymenobacteraceae bacterium]|nr:16S rRNA (uracil(1498)-N(3))-methyltransferase [Hymenobacteraceae bacterium]
MPYRFFLPDPPPGDLLPLPDDEAHHLTRVLRLTDGAAVEALDGRGHRYYGHLTASTKRGALLRVERRETAPPPAPALHLLVAPPKNLDRLEWLLEKATELGLARFTPILTQHAERRELKLDRLRKITIAALKQSGGAWLPVLDELTPLAGALAAVDSARRLVAHLTTDPAERVALPRALTGGTGSVAVLVGPEGDFTAAEVAQARAGGFQPVTLGSSVLRTETAALFAACVVRASAAA